MKSEDEVMASYLLNGGRMLSVTCKDCGAPLFEVAGNQCCVVCKELGKPGVSDEKKEDIPEKPVTNDSRVPSAQVQVTETVYASLEQAICALCRKAMEASRSDDAKTYMDAVRAGADALQALKNS